MILDSLCKLAVKSITNLALERKEGLLKTRSECVKTDVNKCGLASIDPLDRDAWRAGVRHGLELTTPLNGARTAP